MLDALDYTLLLKPGIFTKATSTSKSSLHPILPYACSDSKSQTQYELRNRISGMNLQILFLTSTKSLKMTNTALNIFWLVPNIVYFDQQPSHDKFSDKTKKVNCHITTGVEVILFCSSKITNFKKTLTRSF